MCASALRATWIARRPKRDVDPEDHEPGKILGKKPPSTGPSTLASAKTLGEISLIAPRPAAITDVGNDGVCQGDQRAAARPLHRARAQISTNMVGAQARSRASPA